MKATGLVMLVTGLMFEQTNTISLLPVKSSFHLCSCIFGFGEVYIKRNCHPKSLYMDYCSHYSPTHTASGKTQSLTDLLCLVTVASSG